MHIGVVVAALAFSAFELITLADACVNAWSLWESGSRPDDAGWLRRISDRRNERWLPLVMHAFAPWWVIASLQRSLQRARVLGASDFARDPRLAGCWFFVPIANVWMAPSVATEAVRVARFDPRATEPWHDEHVPLVVPTWWLLVVLGVVLKLAARFYVEGARETTLETHAWLFTVAASCVVVASNIAGVVVSNLLHTRWSGRASEADRLLAEEKASRRRRA